MSNALGGESFVPDSSSPSAAAQEFNYPIRSKTRENRRDERNERKNERTNERTNERSESGDDNSGAL